MKLYNACQRNNYKKKIVLKTNSKTGYSLFESDKTSHGIMVFETLKDLQMNIKSL